MVQIEQAKPAANLNNRLRKQPSTETVPPKLPMTKRDRLQARLEQGDGASLTQLQNEFGWQPHTVRAAISGLRKAGSSATNSCNKGSNRQIAW